jgi:hypothetical protein
MLTQHEVHAQIQGRTCHLWRPESILMPGFMTFEGDEPELRDCEEQTAHGLMVFDQEHMTVAVTLLGFWFSTLSTLN